MFGQPVDDHTYDKKYEYRPVVAQNLGDGWDVPVAANAVYHRLCGVPCGFIGNGWIEVWPWTEEQSCEGDEYEGHKYVPTVVQPLNIFVREDAGIDAADQGATKEYARPNGEDHQHRTWPEPVAGEKGPEDDARYQTA